MAIFSFQLLSCSLGVTVTPGPGSADSSASTGATMSDLCCLARSAAMICSHSVPSQGPSTIVRSSGQNLSASSNPPCASSATASKSLLGAALGGMAGFCPPSPPLPCPMQGANHPNQLV